MIYKRIKQRDAEYDLSLAELNNIVRKQAMEIEELRSDSISQADKIEEQGTLIDKLENQNTQLEEQVDNLKRELQELKDDVEDQTESLRDIHGNFDEFSRIWQERFRHL